MTAEYGESPRPTSKQRVLSVSKMSEEPQEVPNESSRDEEDDDQDCKSMMYVGTASVTIDKILNKLMFDEQILKKQRFEFECN